MSHTQDVGRLDVVPYPDTPLNEAEKQYPLPPSTLDPEPYRDPAHYLRELQEVFFKAWLPVVPAAEVAGPKDYVTWDQLEQSVVIIRDKQGVLHAWHNVCQHRGAWLVPAGAGVCRTGRFKCPWHGFVYDAEGKVISVPFRESFDADELTDLRSPAVRVQEWGGWIWLTLSDETPALGEYLGYIGRELSGYGLERFRVAHRQSVTLKANWKLVVDAFNETWHVPFTHQDTLVGTVLRREAVLRITDPHSWMTIPIRGFSDRVTSPDHRQTHLCHYLAFPNTIFSCFPTHLQMWSAWPVGPDETVLSAYNFVGPPPEGLTDERWAARNQRDWDQFLTVLAEDSEVINDFASTTRSLGFRRNLFNTAESSLTAFHTQITKRLEVGRS